MDVSYFDKSAIFLVFQSNSRTFKGLKVHFLSNLFSFYLCLFKTYGCNLLILKIDGCNCTRCTCSNKAPVHGGAKISNEGQISFEDWRWPEFFMLFYLIFQIWTLSGTPWLRQMNKCAQGNFLMNQQSLLTSTQMGILLKIINILTWL